MDKLNRPLGCGIWLVWLFLGLFSAEWLLFWMASQTLPKEWLLPAVIGSVIVTILGGWVAVFARMQRRRE